MLKSTQTGFYDLNVLESCFDNASSKNALATLLNLGYRTIAVNQIIDVDSAADTKKKKKKGEPRDLLEPVPAPFCLNNLRKIALELNIDNVTFYNRLTLAFTSQDHLQKYIKSNNFKKYDIVAVIPATTAALMFAVSLDFDILGYDPQYRTSLRITRKIYNQLVDKGVYLELTYGPAIQNSTKRKNVIHLSHLYHTYGKSRNIIFSSGAENHTLIRGPYDIISLGFLFGLNELQSKNAMLHCPRNVTVNAMGRRHGKSIMMVENIEVMQAETSVISIESDESDEIMDIDEPVQKKSKQ